MEPPVRYSVHFPNFAEGQDAFLWVTVSLSFAKERVRLNARPAAFLNPFGLIKPISASAFR